MSQLRSLAPMEEFPNVRHLYTHRMYREVATTPLNVLAQILEGAHFAVKIPEDEDMYG
jgi:toprim domain protein